MIWPLLEEEVNYNIDQISTILEKGLIDKLNDNILSLRSSGSL
jgi:hypothetical protein